MGKTAFDTFSEKFLGVTALLPEKCVFLERVKNGKPAWIVIDFLNKKTALARNSKSFTTDFPTLDASVKAFADTQIKASPIAKDAPDAAAVSKG